MENNETFPFRLSSENISSPYDDRLDKTQRYEKSHFFRFEFISCLPSIVRAFSTLLDDFLCYLDESSSDDWKIDFRDLEADMAAVVLGEVCS